MAGITIMQVTVDQIIPSRAVAVCKESSTGKSIEIRLLPMRAGRVPDVGEKWIVDRAYGAWTFAALLTSPTMFPVASHVGATAPSDPKKGDRWTPTLTKVWDGESWVDEA